MARFTQKSKLTSSGLMSHMPGKAKLTNNTKTPFFQSLPENFVATKTATNLAGEVVPTAGFTEETVEFDDDQGLSYETVYDGFVDSASGGKINPKTGVIYNNVDEFEADAIADRTKRTNYKGSYDSTSGTPDRKVISDEFKGLYNFQRRLREGIIKGGPDAWFKILADKGIDPKSEEFMNYMQTQKDFATKRNEKEEEKQKRREYCKQNPDECRKRSSSKPTTTTRTIKGKPGSETYVVPTVQN
tara:strand:+ start:156 stop:887 length:732 start_codon:yes stop_codon:yes gene_type:complete